MDPIKYLNKLKPAAIKPTSPGKNVRTFLYHSSGDRLQQFIVDLKRRPDYRDQIIEIFSKSFTPKKVKVTRKKVNSSIKNTNKG